MRKGFLIYEEMHKYFPIQYMRRPLVIYDFATAPFWISWYIWGKFDFLIYQCRAEPPPPTHPPLQSHTLNCHWHLGFSFIKTLNLFPLLAFFNEAKYIKFSTSSIHRYADNFFASCDVRLKENFSSAQSVKYNYGTEVLSSFVPH